jgi:sensor histidine kinase regulating citrate/malate metabolism
LPITSISTALIFNYIIAKTNLSHNIYVAFSIISFVLLFSNVFVFLIHEKIIQTLRQNAEYQLEIQKTEINQEYYCELERQYETSNILIHDIKKHLTVIKSLAEDEDLIGIKKYIDSVYEGNNVKSLKQFSNNKLINVIISRYYNLCNQNNISLSVDIRNIDFSFISDSDLTALLNNLLENSYEAARESKHKVIDVTISKKNEQFISFYIINSCDTLPQRDGHMFSTSKEDKAHHGFGIKSIIRVANKYYGRADFKYDNTNKKFISSVLLKV